jgi:hypothetical protein
MRVGIKTVAIIATVAGSILLCAAVARAGRSLSLMGTGCIPADTSIQSNIYQSNGFGVSFKGTSTGSIRLYCPMAYLPNSTVTGYTMAFRDTDGTGTVSAVRVYFKKALHGSVTSTAITGTPAPSGGTCNPLSSNTNTATGATVSSCDFPDFVPDPQYFYFFDVFIDRTSSAQNPEFLGVTVTP